MNRKDSKKKISLTVPQLAVDTKSLKSEKSLDLEYLYEVRNWRSIFELWFSDMVKAMLHYMWLSVDKFEPSLRGF